MPVKLSKNLSTDVEIKDGVVYVNDANIRNDFENKNYLDTAVGPRSYAQRPGLEAFKSEQDPFPSRESYVKYAIFRSYMQNQGYTGLELNKIALLNAFNFDALMRNNDFSYTNEVMDVIDKYPNLAVEYPILEQISILSATSATNYNVLTLSDRDVIDGTTKNNYATYIRALANPRIQKVADPVENLRISRLFHMLPLVAVYQHGVGSTLYGFDQVLPQDMIQEAMQNASNLFKLNYWNLQGLSSIFNKTISEDKQFKNFVLTEEEFNNGTPLRAVEATEDPFEALDNEPFIVQPKSLNDPSTYTNYSGGAVGGDMTWDAEGRKVGVTNHQHYTVAYYDKISDQDKAVINNWYNDAANFLGRNIISKDSYAGKLVRRDMLQANSGKSVFAVTELVKPGIKGRKGYNNKMSYSIPEGGTGYAVARGILSNKPVYVFNQSADYGNEVGWYMWDSVTNDFVKTETPKLTKSFTGIGSTQINEAGKQAVRDVYAKTFEEVQPVKPTETPIIAKTTNTLVLCILLSYKMVLV